MTVSCSSVLRPSPLLPSQTLAPTLAAMAGFVRPRPRHSLSSPRRPRHGIIPRLAVRGAVMASASIPLPSRAPYFELPEPLTGKLWSLHDFDGSRGLLAMFICNHCPFVAHLKPHLAKLADEYMRSGVGIVAISSNSVKTHPQDGPRFMAEEAQRIGYPFPYLYDESQQVAKAFGAVCTPDFFLYKKDGRRPFELVYHGQFDDSRPNNNRPITGKDLRKALDCVVSGQPLHIIQKASMGCSIKWHPQ